jgi:hypothetical protein
MPDLSPADAEELLDALERWAEAHPLAGRTFMASLGRTWTPREFVEEVRLATEGRRYVERDRDREDDRGHFRRELTAGAEFVDLLLELRERRHVSLAELIRESAV